MMSDKDIPASGIGPDQHLHDLRAVHDMGNLRIDPTADASDRRWSVLRLSPDPYSGSATLIGGAIDGTTGKIIEAATGRVVAATSLPAGMIQEGSWELLTRIGAPRGKQRGRYKWTEPLASDKRTLEPDDVYHPFSKGGVVLCRHNPQLEGAAQFNSVSLLPPEWETDVRPVFNALQKNKVLSMSSTGPSQRVSLRSMLQNDNPILASMAFRALAEAGDTDPQTLRQSLSQSNGYRRAVFTYIALVHLQTMGESAIENDLMLAVQSTRRPPDSRPTALAVAAAALFHPELPRTRSLSLKLLGAVRSQSLRLPRKQAPDSYVERLLKVMQAP